MSETGRTTAKPTKRRSAARRASLITLGLALTATMLSGCDGMRKMSGKPGPFDSPWNAMEPMRYATVKGVTYDVNLRWFRGPEREMMVHRVDLQPMFQIDAEQEKARLAALQAYASDVCFGAPLTVNHYVYEIPGVWVVHGQCPEGVAPIPPQYAKRKSSSVLAWLFGG